MLPAADTAACRPAAVWGWPWVRPLSILRLDIADRAVIRVAGDNILSKYPASLSDREST